MVERLLELGDAAMLHLVEGEEDASGLRVGHEGDDEALELLGALAGLEGVEVALGSASAPIGGGPPSAALRASFARLRAGSAGHGVLLLSRVVEERVRGERKSAKGEVAVGE